MMKTSRPHSGASRSRRSWISRISRMVSGRSQSSQRPVATGSRARNERQSDGLNFFKDEKDFEEYIKSIWS